MHFDALTLACVAAELNITLDNGRVQQVLLVDETSVGLEVYAAHTRYYLLLSAASQGARIHLSGQKLRRGSDRQPPLLLLLRKYVRGATLGQILQPDPTERVLVLHCHHPEHGSTSLVAELIGHQANLLLLDAHGVILDSLRRVDGRSRDQRTLFPQHPYQPPFPQHKVPPLDDGSPDYYDRLAAVIRSERPLRLALVDQIAGVSPTLGRELAWRIAGDEQAPAQSAELVALVQSLQEIWAPVLHGSWQPGTLWDEQGIVAFTPYQAHVIGAYRPETSISHAVEAYFAASSTRVPGEIDGYATARSQMAALLDRAEQRLRRRLEALDADTPQPGEADRLRTEAEWLLALHHQIQPGQESLSVDQGGLQIRIPLDHNRTPVEQAQRRFKRAAKLERAAAYIPGRRAKIMTDLEYLDQLRTDVALGDSRETITAARAELAAMGLLAGSPAEKRRRGKMPKPGQPLRYESPTGIEILVGRNARQNEVVTFDLANPTDLWLHVRGTPGSHVVVRAPGNQVDEETIEMAARLAAFYSRQRGEKAAIVSLTEKRFVQRLPGGRPGQVSVRNERTVTVPAEWPPRN